ncbi:hypothetical protein AH70_03060 [Pediococcus damnosus LMG 28219]|uniref:hypothetical protein n=1 Tax=Pediococcus damnosus TaxID=51663 RepID=UPI00061E89FC|nr:hypothetical protein [Pediococcus damnosus]KJU75023.1 hypothetical protein AH70_03060 [Pediococcus damnosus LMG 28219]PIO86299.1 hypothetical protein BSQ38_00195 [Pediococcus damnosus]
MTIQAFKNLEFDQFSNSLNALTLTQYMGTIFEKNNYQRGEKDVMIRFVSLLMNSIIESGQVLIDVALKVQDDILGTIEFKKDIPPFEIWMKQKGVLIVENNNKVAVITGSAGYNCDLIIVFHFCTSTYFIK